MIPISVHTTEEVVKVRVVNGNSFTIAIPVTYEIKVTEPNFIAHTHTISQIKGLAGRLNKIEKLAKAGL